ncbi:MAG: DNA polymerase III subunit gamma/tau [Candidatus Riflebacteria bacterium]|nr:DNA polymerase III subunit gamma/tau [Candidatus Riflebacteria bacterium]
MNPIKKRNLYRKYRPSSFSELLGQDHIVKTLQNAISSGRVSHAYMFCGPRGTGKTSTARLLAKILNCTSPVKDSQGLPDSCRICENCVKIEELTYVDIIEIDAASNNSVDDIREMREKVKYRPIEGQYKIYIIDEVHMLSGAAFNAFLKTLEEPPSRVIFILATTDPQKVPATIISRCQLFDFHSVSRKVIIERLREIVLKEKSENPEFPNVSEEVLQIISECAEGGFRDALGLLDQISSTSSGAIKVEDVLEITRRLGFQSLLKIGTHFFNNDAASFLIELNLLFSSGYDVSSIGKDFLEFLRKAMLLKIDPKSAQVLEIPKDQEEKLLSLCLLIPIERILNSAQRLERNLSLLRHSVNPKFLFEVEMLRLCRGDFSQNLEIIEKRISELEVAIKSPRVIVRPPSSGITQTFNPISNFNPYLQRSASISTLPPSSNTDPTAISNSHLLTTPLSSGVKKNKFYEEKVDQDEDFPDFDSPDQLEPPKLSKSFSQTKNFSEMNLKQKWKAVLNLLNNKNVATGSALSASEVVSFENQILTVSFESEFSLKKTKEPRTHELLQSILNEVFGEGVKLIATQKNSKEGKVFKDSNEEPAFSSFQTNISKLDKEAKQRLLSKPEIKDALEIFGGEVTEIEN